jgi:hypothetical protein
MTAVLAAAPAAAPPVLHQAALLAGLGPRARDVLAALAAPTPGTQGHTCIDAGAPAVLAVSAPGPRRFDVHTRGGAGGAGEHEWSGVRAGRGTPDLRFRRTVFTGRTGRAAVAAEAAAGTIGAAGEFRAVHRSLGPNGRIWSVTLEPWAAGVSWQVDRGVHAATALRALGCAGIWETAAEAVADVVGALPDPASGLWSIGVVFTGAGPFTFRVGSSQWARLPDDDTKIARLAAWVERHGGDRPFAAAVYRLLLSARPRRCLRPIGRAVEVDVAAGRVVGTHAYLTVPGASAGSTEGSPR